MNVGELFVNLGIKGTDKTVGAIGSVKKGMDGLASTSIEAKAAILGAMYALERMVASSGQLGTDLLNFSATTGVSTKVLQEYQIAGKLVGASNKEIENSFRSLQSSMTKLLMGEGGPKGLAWVSQVTGITKEEIAAFQQAPQLLIQRLQQFAGSEKNKGLVSEILNTFGIQGNAAAGVMRQVFTSKNFKLAPILNPNDEKQLDSMRAKFALMGFDLETKVGKALAENGPLVKTLSEDFVILADAAIKFASAVAKLVGETKALSYLGKLFEGMASALGLAGKGAEAIRGAVNDPKKRMELGHDVLSFAAAVPGKAADAEIGFLKSSFLSNMASFMPALAPAALMAPVAAPILEFFRAWSKTPALPHNLSQDARVEEKISKIRPIWEKNPGVPSPSDIASPRMPATNQPAPNNHELTVIQNYKDDGKNSHELANKSVSGFQKTLRQFPQGGF